VNDQEFGYSRLQASRTELRVQFISDRDGGVRDEFVLTKPKA
jgi:hypothetical protein